MSENLDALVSLTQAVSSINPKNVDPALSQAGDPTIILDDLQRQVDAVGNLQSQVDFLATAINAELMDVQLFIEQQQSQMAGVEQPMPGATTEQAQYSMGSKKIFNLIKTAQNWVPPINTAPTGGFGGANNAEMMMQPGMEGTEEIKDITMESDNTIEGVLSFVDASDLKNWLDMQGSRTDAEDKLMELVPSDQKETITSSMQDYYETELTEEEKLVLATEIWPILPDFVKEDKPGVQENIMELPYDQSKDIDSVISESEEQIKKIAQTDSKKTQAVFNLRKTAQHKSSENVILYGPDQVYVDDFTRQPASRWSLVERNKGFGLTVGDVWDIDWEAAWRGNIMDKYSRPYRDTDGKWVGGYLQKRFEIDSWIPEGNNYQLKPGEKRRPYIPEQRSTEARMVAQRASADCPYEGTEKNKPFNWKEASSKKKR